LLCDKFLKYPQKLLVFFGISHDNPYEVTQAAEDGEILDKNSLFKKIVVYTI
jgi:hypothetical protein